MGFVGINDLPIDFGFKMQLHKRLRQQDNALNKYDSDQAKADPKKHKLSRVMEGRYGLNYYWLPSGKDGLGRKVYFCWSKHRNVAGYFLTWREVYSIPRGKDKRQRVKRDQWVARKVKKRARALAEKRSARFKQKHTPTV